MARSLVLFACLLLLVPSLVSGSFLYKTMRKRKLTLQPKVPPNEIPPDTWFQQRLDHFNPRDSRTWLQRYFVNDTFWDPKSGPVFLNIEGEGEASPVWVLKGEMMVNAQKYKALAVSMEHRFYGKSHPTPDLSTDNLRYLSSHQALADIANFHDYIVRQYKLTEMNRWIAFGGSYSGALAAWLRIKYPHIVFGSIASSAPVLAEMDFYQYMEVVGQSLAQSKQGQPCVDAIKAAMENVSTMAMDRSNWPILEKIFNIKPPLSSPEDVSILGDTLAGTFAGVVQYNNDAGKGDINMDTLCAVMVNTTLGGPVARLAALTAMFSGPDGISCSVSSLLDSVRDTKWDNTTTLGAGGRQWFYQTCIEFGYFQTTDSKNQPFGNLISVEMFTSVCQVLFNIDPYSVGKNINQTNYLYGGKEVGKSVTNIVFPNGSIDPWHALGVTSNISDSLVAIFISGTAHCANMYPASPKDSPELVQAREMISAYILDWLTCDVKQ